MKLNKAQIVFMTVGTLIRGIKVHRKGLDASEWVNV